MKKQDNGESLSTKADAAFEKAAGKVIERAKQTQTPVVIWEDGKIKEVAPDELQESIKKTKTTD